MPYDPSYPATNALIESAPMRGQFNGLKDLIDAIQTITAAAVDATNTLPPGNPATVSVSVSGNTLHFTFGIPQGLNGTDGTNGNDGAQGPQGDPGPQGPMGEISNMDLSNAISGTSANSNGVGTLGLVASSPPTQYEMQAVADKLDELINALRR